MLENRLRFTVIIETKGLVRFADSIYLFRAEDFGAAFHRAIETGRMNEQKYLNGPRWCSLRFADQLAVRFQRIGMKDCL